MNAVQPIGSATGGQAAVPALLPMINPASWQDVPPPARRWVLDGYIPVGQMTYLTGAGSVGKSLLGQQLATCIALGIPFLGIDTTAMPALYLTCEDDADELHRRQIPICDAVGAGLPALSGKLILSSLIGAGNSELATFDEYGRLHAAPAWQRLCASVAATGVRFVVLDNVAHLFIGNENVRPQVAAFCNLLNELAQAIDGAVLLLGHPNKAGDSFSGSTAWENQVRARLFMETPRSADGAVLDPDARVLSRGKANYARNGETVSFRWHRWAFVRDSDLPAGHRAEIAANVQATAENERFLACLDERNRQRRQVSERQGANYAPAQFAKMPEAMGMMRPQFEVAMDRLFRIGAIERGFLYRDTAEGKDIFGLRRASGNPPGNHPETPSGNDRKPAEVDRKHTPLDTTYLSGAAHEAAAPCRENDPWPDPADEWDSS